MRLRFLAVVPVSLGVALRASTLLSLLCLATALGGQSASANAPRVAVRVAALNNPPYVVMAPGGLQGLSIAAFRIIAAENNWAVTYLPERTLDELTNAIITHQADIGIGGITPTPELSLVVDFSDANQIVPLALLVRTESPWSRRLHIIAGACRIFVSGEMLMLFLVGLIAVLVGGYAIRRIERRRDREMFPPEFRHNAWWAAQTLVAHNCGSKLPNSERGRYVAIILMLGGTVFTAQMTAVLTTSLATSVRATAPITSIGDVGTRPIATVHDSYAKTWLQQNLVNLRSYPTVAAAVAAVADGSVAGAAYDELALRRALREPHAAGLAIVGDTFGSHPHAFMLPKRSPFLAPLNGSLDILLQSQRWQTLTQSWLGAS